MNDLQIIENHGQRILLTSQLAELYETTTDTITKNFNRHIERYQEGKHFFALEGEEKREFLNLGQFDLGLKNTKTLYLWTEHGALLHAKSLGTDKAWEVYGELVDTYFRVKQSVSVMPQDYPAALRALADEAEKRLLLLSENAQQKQMLAEFSPKASYYDVVLQTKDAMSTSQIAKDYGKSAQWLNDYLHKKSVQFKQGDVWLLYQKHAEMGYTKSKTHTYSGMDGNQHSKLHTYWTQKGRLFIYNLLKSDGVLPLMEDDNYED